MKQPLAGQAVQDEPQPRVTDARRVSWKSAQEHGDQNNNRPAQEPSCLAAAAGTQQAGGMQETQQPRDAGQHSTVPGPAQQQPEGPKAPPPGFCQPQHTQNGPAQADWKGFNPHEAQAPGAGASPGAPPPAMQQQQPLQPQATFKQRPPADGAQQWQQAHPPMDPQAAFYGFAPAQTYGGYPQQQAPPRSPGYAPDASYPAATAGYDTPPTAFPAAAGAPAAHGFLTWQQAQAFGPPYGHQHHVQPHAQQPQAQQRHAQHAAAMGLLALQQLAQQRKHHQSAAYIAAHPPAGAAGHRAHPPAHTGFSPAHGNHMAGQHKPPAASRQANNPPPPPRQAGMQGHNNPMNMNSMRPGPRPQHTGHPGGHQSGHAAGGYGNTAGGAPAGRNQPYPGFNGRQHNQGWQQGGDGRTGNTWRQQGQRTSSTRESNGGTEGPVNPVVAALPRSSSSLWAVSMPGTSPRVSSSEVRRSSLYPDLPSLSAMCAPPSAEISAHVQAAAAAGMGGAAAGLPASDADTGKLSAWLSSAASPWAPAPRVTSGNQRSSGGGSLMGRSSSRSLAWDPLSTLSSGGGSKPSAGAPPGSASGRNPGRHKAMAAKVPLVYTPVMMQEQQNVWGAPSPPAVVNHSAAVGDSFGFAQLQPDQLSEMFRKLRADVRGPFARPL